MNQELELSNTGGFPFDQDTLSFMQGSYRASFDAIASAFGENVILSGVVDTGTNYTDGWMIVNGELLPFVGGIKAATVLVNETVVQLVFEDNESKDVEKVRFATTGSTGGIAFTEFIRIKPLADLFAPEKRWDHLIPAGVVWHVKMTDDDIDTHFDSSGLGISDQWLGWRMDADSNNSLIIGKGTVSGSIEADGSAFRSRETVSREILENQTTPIFEVTPRVVFYVNIVKL